MKGTIKSRGLKALAVSMALGLGMTACSRDYTVAYLYVTNAKATPGLITAYAIDYQSGALIQLSDSPIPSGGNNPVALVASPNSKYVYVLNQNTSSVVQFDIGTDGKLYPTNTYSVVQGNGLTGTFPTAAAIDPTGKFLYITFLFQNGFTAVHPGPGGIATFPINTDGSLGTALTNTTIGATVTNPLPYIPVGDNPIGITIPATGGFVYVIDQENPLTSSAHGVLLSFTENATSGALTPITGSSFGGVAAGTTPSAITEDPSGHFLYVADSTNNQLNAFTVTGGVPSPIPRTSTTSPTIATGLTPMGIAIDPRGKFLYVANFNSNTVGTYAIDPSSGALSGTGGGLPVVSSVGTGPTCVTIDPAIGIYLYTSNNTDSSVSAEQLDPHSGALKQVQGTQFSSQVQPTCAVAVANGAHATQIVE
jgi:6-phosphogluconolactonase